MEEIQRRLGRWVNPDTKLLSAVDFVNKYREDIVSFLFLPDNNGVKIDYETYLVIHAFKHVMQFRNIKETLNYFNENSSTVLELGIKELPNAHQINFFRRYHMGVLSDGTDLYKEFCLSLDEFLDRRMVVISDPYINPRARKQLCSISKEQKHLMVKNAKKLLFEFAKSNEVVRNYYSDKDIWDLLVIILCEQVTISSFATTNRDAGDYQRGKIPSGHTIFNRLRQWFKTDDEFIEFHLTLNRRMFDFLRKRCPEWFSRCRKFNIALDMTSNATWEGTRKSEHPDSTALHFDANAREQHHAPRFRKFLVASVVHAGFRFMLAFLPLRNYELSQMPVKVKKLLLLVKQLVPIGVVVADRGFENRGVIKAINSLKLKFLMPTIKTSPNKKIGGQSDVDVLITDRIIGGERVATMVLIKEPKGVLNYKYTYFTTNLPVTVHNAKTIIKIYPRRWSIETGFNELRMFRLPTTSRDTTVRVFFFGASMMVYNIWLLASIIVYALYVHAYPTKHIMTKDEFSSIARQLDDPPPS